MQLRAFLLPAALFALTAMQAQNLEIVNDSVAAPPDPERYPYSIYVNLSAGPSIIGLKTGYRNMQQLLKDQGINIPPRHTQYVMGYGARIRRWYIDMAVQLAPSYLDLPYYLSDYPVDSMRYLNAEFNYFNSSINIGYAFLQTRNDLWVVRGGVGWSQYNIRITETAPVGSFNFDNVAGTPSWRSWPTFSHHSAVGNVSIEWQRGGRAKRGVSLAPGLIAGYQFGLGQPRWKLGNIPVLNAPSDRAGFAYLGVDFKIARNFERKSKN
jgi:hypothetical protein